MSGFARAMRVFADPSAERERRLMQHLLVDLLNDEGLVRFQFLLHFHDYICRKHGFNLMQNTTFGVPRGGRHLFYVNGHILLRVKTIATDYRPPHMTISLATGCGWDDEVAKLSRNGRLVPKQGAIPRADHRALRRLGGDFNRLRALDDAWADSCHFNFVSGFNAAHAESLAIY